MIKKIKYGDDNDIEFMFLFGIEYYIVYISIYRDKYVYV